MIDPENERLVELLEDIHSDDDLPLASGQKQDVPPDSEASVDGYETKSEGEIDAEDLQKKSKRRPKTLIVKKLMVKKTTAPKRTQAPKRRKKKTAAGGGAGDGADDAAEEDDDDSGPRPINKIKPFTPEEVIIIFSC